MSDSRNVADKYKGWHEDLIKKDLNKNTFPFACLMEQWQGDFNIGTMVRNANAFGASEVFYIGERRKWDRRGSVGTYKYTNVNFLDSFEALDKLKEKYTFVGVDNLPGAVMINSFEWKPNTLMIFGEEGVGLTPEIRKYCEVMVEIPMFGSVRSLNAGTSSGIVMFDYVRKMTPGA